MRKASVIEKETQQISTVEDLTGVFESIASIQVAKIKDKVEMSKQFFQLLWQRYSAIRIDPASRLNRWETQNNGRKAFVIISAEAGLSGDIDERLIEEMMKDYQPETTDIVVLGTHGATQLKDRRIPYTRFFKVPESDSYIDVSPVIDAVSDYAKITVYYEEYVSLGVQDIKKIDLYSTIQSFSQQAIADEDVISTNDTIFEPSLEEIAELMERGMMSLALSQAIMESGLAQAASRFNAMAAAKKRAFELVAFHKLEYHRSKRSESDRRLHEVLIGIKMKKRKLAKGRA
jgi:F-type H+-transporting ATPase subunit gamma